MKKINALLLVLVMVITMSGFNNVSVKADEDVVLPEYTVTEKVTKTQISKPKISVKVDGDSVTLTIKKNADAEGYLVYVKTKGYDRYHKSDRCFYQSKY